MNYLLDRKTKRKKIIYIIVGVIICPILFYFLFGIFNGLSLVTHTVFRPVLFVGNAISEKLAGFSSYFFSKKSLYMENEDLKSKLNEAQASLANYNSLLTENTNLKEILGRKGENSALVLSAILSKPNQSSYDTLVIDAGTVFGIEAGDMVFAIGNLPIGRISDAYTNSSKVILFSAPGEKTGVVIYGRDVFMEIVGRGGGNFEMVVPRDFVLQKGDTVSLPDIFPYALATVETIISDPRDPYTKAILVSPINIQELKFVQVEKK